MPGPLAIADRLVAGSSTRRWLFKKILLLRKDLLLTMLAVNKSQSTSEPQKVTKL